MNNAGRSCRIPATPRELPFSPPPPDERSIFSPAYKFFARALQRRGELPQEQLLDFSLISVNSDTWSPRASMRANNFYVSWKSHRSFADNSETWRASTFSSAFSSAPTRVSRMRTHRKLTAALNVSPIRFRNSASSSQPVHSRIRRSRLSFYDREKLGNRTKAGVKHEIGRRGTAPDRHRDATGGFVAAPRERTHRPPWCDPPPLTPTRTRREATPCRLTLSFSSSPHRSEIWSRNPNRSVPSQVHSRTIRYWQRLLAYWRRFTGVGRSFVTVNGWELWPGIQPTSGSDQSLAFPSRHRTHTRNICQYAFRSVEPFW